MGYELHAQKHTYELHKEIISGGKFDHGVAERSLQSWVANARRGNTYYQAKRMKQFYYKQMEEKQHDD